MDEDSILCPKHDKVIDGRYQIFLNETEQGLPILSTYQNSRTLEVIKLNKFVGTISLARFILTLKNGGQRYI